MVQAEKALKKIGWKHWVPDTAAMLVLYPLVWDRIMFPAYAIWMGFVLLIGQGGVVLLVCTVVRDGIEKWWGVD